MGFQGRAVKWVFRALGIRERSALERSRGARERAVVSNVHQHGKGRSPYRDEANQAALTTVRAQHVSETGGGSLSAREGAVLEKGQARHGLRLTPLGAARREQR